MSDNIIGQHYRKKYLAYQKHKSDKNISKYRERFSFIKRVAHDFECRLNKRINEIFITRGLEQHLKKNKSGEYINCVDLTFSKIIATSLLDGYYYDIIRYKSFNGMYSDSENSVSAPTDSDGYVNLAKIIAYTTKWILIEKPISFQIGDEIAKVLFDESSAVQDSNGLLQEVLSYLYFINELFALAFTATIAKKILYRKTAKR